MSSSPGKNGSYGLLAADCAVLLSSPCHAGGWLDRAQLAGDAECKRLYSIAEDHWPRAGQPPTACVLKIGLFYSIY